MTKEGIIQEFKEIIWHWIDRQVERDKSKESGEREHYYLKGGVNV